MGRWLVTHHDVCATIVPVAVFPGQLRLTGFIARKTDDGFSLAACIAPFCTMNTGCRDEAFSFMLACFHQVLGLKYVSFYCQILEGNQ